jgi:hypothetical protein
LKKKTGNRLKINRGRGETGNENAYHEEGGRKFLRNSISNKTITTINTQQQTAINQ